MSEVLTELTPADVERFWSKVAVGDPAACWEWTAGRNRHGYGKFTVGPRATAKQYLAHRLALALNGAAPLSGIKIVRHSCDNPACCNPAHLQDGSHAQNMQDKVDRGRAVTAFGNAKLDWPIIDEIRASQLSGAAWADRLGVSKGTISDIRNHKIWKESTRAIALVPSRARS